MTDKSDPKADPFLRAYTSGIVKQVHSFRIKSPNNKTSFIVLVGLLSKETTLK